MSIAGTLKRSLEMLYNEPMLFLPKTFSTLISSGFLVFIGWKAGTARAMLTARPAAFLSVFTVLTLLIGFIGVFASLMVASLVKNREENDMLEKSFREVIGKWKNVALSALLFLFIGFLVAIPASIGIALSGSSILFTVYGFLVSLLILLVISFYSYFIPITLVEESFIEGFLDSARSSHQNSREVLLLTLFSLSLFVFAFLVASRPELEALGYLGFIAGRLLSAFVNTYLFVVSPTYYLEN